MKLPDILAFFSGKRCVPILMSFIAIFLSVLFSYVWPPIQHGLNMMANGLVNSNGDVSLIGLFFSSFLINFLLIFGLHHCVYPLFYYQLGAYTTAAGATDVYKRQAECYQMVEYYKEAARRAKEAGFDGVEVHGAHFYLLGQFMSRYANKRIDEFGGDYKGRFHMAELCIKKVKEACGRDYPVSFRISTEEYLDGGSTLDDAIIYSQLAQDAGADIINISVGSGIGGNIITPSYFNPGFNVEAAARIKAKVTIPTIVVGRINDPILANYIVASGQADLVALGRQSVADSEFPNKVKEGRTEEILSLIHIFS